LLSLRVDLGELPERLVADETYLVTVLNVEDVYELK
jgi:hypothetical protein